jgi:hypothetical protein
MSETRIKIKELEMNGETAIRIAECLKKHEPEIWKVLSAELKQALRIQDVVESLPIQELPNCTRVEVIDQEGRSYVNWKPTNKVRISMQDEGRTAKIFID